MGLRPTHILNKLISISVSISISISVGPVFMERRSTYLKPVIFSLDIITDTRITRLFTLFFVPIKKRSPLVRAAPLVPSVRHLTAEEPLSYRIVDRHALYLLFQSLKVSFLLKKTNSACTNRMKMKFSSEIRSGSRI